MVSGGLTIYLLADLLKECHEGGKVTSVLARKSDVDNLRESRRFSHLRSLKRSSEHCSPRIISSEHPTIVRAFEAHRKKFRGHHESNGLISISREHDVRKYVGLISFDTPIVVAQNFVTSQ
jgi:hypothetical protein